jgi:hypothetical protein
VHFVGFVLLSYLSGCELPYGLGGDCEPRTLTLVVNVSPEELDDAIEDDVLSEGECRRLCPRTEVDKVLGCDLFEPDTGDTGGESQVSCDVEAAGDC